jgi:serpin B
MYLTDTVDYMSVPAASAVLLPYDDGRFAFLGILPDKSTTLDEYIMTMDARTIPDLISLKRSTNIAVTLPKFTASEDIELMNVLNNMGLGIAFDGSKADFSKMGKAGESLVISSVKHKTFLQVDELGTEAGAVTDAAIRATGINTSLQTIVFNRPFIYAVVDTQTNLPLFFGTMESPQS